MVAPKYGPFFLPGPANKLLTRGRIPSGDNTIYIARKQKEEKL
jgi:hypothetical protein